MLEHQGCVLLLKISSLYLLSLCPSSSSCHLHSEQADPSFSITLHLCKSRGKLRNSGGSSGFQLLCLWLTAAKMLHLNCNTHSPSVYLALLGECLTRSPLNSLSMQGVEGSVQI